MLEISVQELVPFVQMIRTLNQQLTDTLYQLKTQMIMVENYWEGDTSRMFQEKALTLDRKIEQYQEVIERYAAHLESIIEQYRLTEQNLYHNVASF